MQSYWHTWSNSSKSLLLTQSTSKLNPYLSQMLSMSQTITCFSCFIACVLFAVQHCRLAVYFQYIFCSNLRTTTNLTPTIYSIPIDDKYSPFYPSPLLLGSSQISRCHSALHYGNTASASELVKNRHNCVLHQAYYPTNRISHIERIAVVATGLPRSSRSCRLV